MKTLKFIILIICFVFTSCFSTKKLIDESKNTPTEFSIEKINGVYKNQIENNNYTYAQLWNILADNYSFKRDFTLISENSSVKLEFINQTELKVSLIENDSITKSMIFKGKIVDDYFSINKKFLLIPIPALLFHKERKTIIGINKNGNLILTRGYKNAGWVLLFSTDFGGISSFEFEQKKTNHNTVYN